MSETERIISAAESAHSDIDRLLDKITSDDWKYVELERIADKLAADIRKAKNEVRK